jgi:hypothetical protein
MAPACRPKGNQIGFLTDDYNAALEGLAPIGWPLGPVGDTSDGVHLAPSAYTRRKLNIKDPMPYGLSCLAIARIAQEDIFIPDHFGVVTPLKMEIYTRKKDPKFNRARCKRRFISSKISSCMKSARRNDGEYP